MAILVLAELENKSVKKSSFEAIYYASKISDDVNVIVLGEADNLASLGNYGAKKVLHVSNSVFNDSHPEKFTNALVEIVSKVGGDTLIMAKSSLVDSIASKVAIKIGASVSGNIVELPDTSSGFKIKKSIYTGKAFIVENITSAKKVLVIKKNAVEVQVGTASANVESMSVTVSEEKVKQIEVNKAKGIVLLPEAEIVVSAGRGMKGPENWGIIEELASVLGAATACSKPVSDTDWRPHHEHVGQTGVKVSPNLYIAVGISGAIQHLAGVNSSKVIVVINKDPEAPFFKAADYGIVGDLFDVVPKLTTALKAVS